MLLGRDHAAGPGTGQTRGGPVSGEATRAARFRFTRGLVRLLRRAAARSRWVLRPRRPLSADLAAADCLAAAAVAALLDALRRRAFPEMLGFAGCSYFHCRPASGTRWKPSATRVGEGVHGLVRALRRLHTTHERIRFASQRGGETAQTCASATGSALSRSCRKCRRHSGISTSCPAILTSPKSNAAAPQWARLRGARVVLTTLRRPTHLRVSRWF